MMKSDDLSYVLKKKPCLPEHPYVYFQVLGCQNGIAVVTKCFRWAIGWQP